MDRCVATKTSHLIFYLILDHLKILYHITLTSVECSVLRRHPILSSVLSQIILVSYIKINLTFVECSMAKKDIQSYLLRVSYLKSPYCLISRLLLPVVTKTPHLIFCLILDHLRILYHINLTFVECSVVTKRPDEATAPIVTTARKADCLRRHW